MPTVLFTGGHAGLGLEAATRLASEARADLVLAGRDLSRVEAGAQQLRQTYGIRVTPLKMDVSSLASVRSAASAFHALLDSGEMDPPQAIVCNAGAQFHGPVSWSPEGYEETFTVNFLGHFLLVNLLLDSVAEGGRIVFTASGTHDGETIDGKIVGPPVEPDAFLLANQGKGGAKALSAGKRYATAKLCTILFSNELARRLKRARVPIAAISFDPGLIPETELGRTAPKFLQRLSRAAVLKVLFRRLGVTMGSIGFSGASLAKIALDPSFADASGKYFQSSDGSLVEARSSKVSYDEERAMKLWTDSERLVELKADEQPRRLSTSRTAP
jgi:NAD(P)-dependent dehydrogenase (short-subunit alcohol dehydrogenase family)